MRLGGFSTNPYLPLSKIDVTPPLHEDGRFYLESEKVSFKKRYIWNKDMWIKSIYFPISTKTYNQNFDFVVNYISFLQGSRFVYEMLHE